MEIENNNSDNIGYYKDNKMTTRPVLGSGVIFGSILGFVIWFYFSPIAMFSGSMIFIVTWLIIPCIIGYNLVRIYVKSGTYSQNTNTKGYKIFKLIMIVPIIFICIILLFALMVIISKLA